jgi:thiol:disulfide interchange protein
MRHLAVALALLLPTLAVAEPWESSIEYGDVSVVVDPPKALPGEVVKVKITVTPQPGCTTYPFFTNPTSKNNLVPKADTPLVFVGPLKNPDGAEPKKSATGEVEDVYMQAVTWELTAVVSPKATASPGPIEVKAFVQICKEKCDSFKKLSLPLEILAGEPKKVPDEYAGWVQAYLSGDPIPLDGSKEPPAAAGTTNPPPKPVEPQTTPTPTKKADTPEHAGIIKKAPLPADEYAQRMDELAGKIGQQKVTREGGLLGLLLTAAFWGLVSLATPCVFPMIPITVSLFLKQSHQSAAGAARLAGVYCLTIIVVLGASAVLMLSVFRALSVNPWMNVGLGALFVVFALSLFGMYEITLPNFLLRGAEAGRKKGGLVGTIFGAVAFSIVSFTCVAPFLGGFAGLASSGQYEQWELVLAGVTYATAFASPFFILALVPSLLKALPRSGGWMDTVKAVMGFLELAAALKFFRTAELRWLPVPAYFTYDIVLVGWVVIAASCGLYLLGLFRLPHDEPHERIGVPRLMFALLFLGLGAYLLPGVFKGPEGKPQRPGGVVFAWVDAFLLPEPSAGEGGLPWGTDLPDAIKKADESKRLVFVDFTGTTCTNCKANEQTVFPRAEINSVLKKYELVQMYTDDVPAEFYTRSLPTSAREAEGEVNLNFQRKVFGTEQLPLYVILEPQAGGGAKVLGVYDEGLINDPAKFADFLKKPLEGR